MFKLTCLGSEDDLRALSAEEKEQEKKDAKRSVAVDDEQDSKRDSSDQSWAGSQNSPESIVQTVLEAKLGDDVAGE